MWIIIPLKPERSSLELNFQFVKISKVHGSPDRSTCGPLGGVRCTGNGCVLGGRCNKESGREGRFIVSSMLTKFGCSVLQLEQGSVSPQRRE